MSNDESKCTNTLGDLSCSNVKEHTGGQDRRGCIFVSPSMTHVHAQFLKLQEEENND